MDNTACLPGSNLWRIFRRRLRRHPACNYGTDYQRLPDPHQCIKTDCVPVHECCGCCVLSFSGKVVWPVALVMAAGALAGGSLGGRLAGKINPVYLRWIVVSIGMVVGVIYLVR